MLEKPCEVNIFLLIGCSCVGKTTLAKQLARQIDLACLENDRDVMKKIFNLFVSERDKMLHTMIGSINKWQYLYELGDIDQLFKLYHRDYFIRSGMPRNILAIGWLYSMKRWRELTYAAFGEAKGFKFQYHCLHLRPTEQQFIERFMERTNTNPTHGKLEYDERKKKALNHFNKYLEDTLEKPAEDENIAFIEVKDYPEAFNYINKALSEKL